MDRIYDVELLVKIKEKLGISWGDLRRAAGISKAGMSMIANGLYNSPQSTLLPKVVKALKEAWGIADADNIILVDLKKPPTRRKAKKPNKSQALNELKLKRKKKLEVKVLPYNVLKFFGLKTNPFTAHIPAPSQMFLNENVTAVEEAILNAAKNNEFLLVAGECGAGKTTIIRKILRQLEREQKLLVSMPDKHFIECVSIGYVGECIIQDFGKRKPPNNYREKSRAIVQVVQQNYKQNIKMVMLIDEAHRMNKTTLRALKRFWEGFGHDGSAMSIILVGQPYIHEVLSDVTMAEVQRRLSVVELDPFGTQNEADILAYIRHKIKQAGGDENLFTEGAARAVFKYARTPLEINNLCVNALVEAARIQEKQITEEVIENV